MSALVLAGIGLLGGAGALGRFVLDAAVTARAGDRFPWGTLAVNLSGALALGVLVGAAVEGDGLRLAGTGLLGAFTTFSTWMLDTHELPPRLAALNVVGSLVPGVLLAWLGSSL